MKTQLGAVAALLLLMACNSKSANKEPVPTAAAPPVGMPVAPLPASCTDDAQCPLKNLCLSSACAPIHSGMPECSLVRVHFEVDAAELKTEEFSKMNRMARCLKADHGMKLDVRGSADERGDESYNLALGEKRARIVARYLENQGVSETQLNTVSFGEDRPLCTEHNEECWTRNRRVGLSPK